MTTSKRSPFSIWNIKLFIAFRVFFNARFYYPVFTIIFLDFGLTIEQFAILNSVWAVTIVLAEVPSGALADTIGRKKLLLTTAILMMAEMFLLCFVPLGNSTLIFWAFLINRILSGLAEAMASGADEAIAYDSLKEKGDEKDWPKVISVQMRVSSVASILTMTTGAMLYDPDMVNSALGYLGFHSDFSQQVTMRFPLYLTLLLSVLATSTALMMTEVQTNENEEGENQDGQKHSIVDAMQMTLKAGGWILKTPFAFAVILFGMSFDHVVRMMVTMTSQYFRLIQLPEAFFGLIGAGISLLGLVVPKLAEKMAEVCSPTQNMLIISATVVTGFIGLMFFIPYLGVLPMALIFVGIMFTSFFSSHYLNRITPSHQRATVLSFKGLAFNLAYGIIGLLFAGLMQYTRNEQRAMGETVNSVIENQAFIQAVGWFPMYTVFVLVLTTLICKYLLRDVDNHRVKG